MRHGLQAALAADHPGGPGPLGRVRGQEATVEPGLEDVGGDEGRLGGQCRPHHPPEALAVVTVDRERTRLGRGPTGQAILDGQLDGRTPQVGVDEVPRGECPQRVGPAAAVRPPGEGHLGQPPAGHRVAAGRLDQCGHHGGAAPADRGRARSGPGRSRSSRSPRTSACR